MKRGMWTGILAVVAALGLMASASLLRADDGTPVPAKKEMKKAEKSKKDSAKEDMPACKMKKGDKDAKCCMMKDGKCVCPYCGGKCKMVWVCEKCGKEYKKAGKCKKCGGECVMMCKCKKCGKVMKMDDGKCKKSCKGKDDKKEKATDKKDKEEKAAPKGDQ